MNVCKFCGAKRAKTPFHSHMAAYYCGSWHDGSRHWSQGIACRNRCEQIRVQLEGTIETLQRRIAKAIEAAKLQARWPHGELVEVVEATAMDLVVAILEGKQ